MPAMDPLPPSSTPFSQVESPQKRRLRALPVVIGKEDRQRLEQSGSVGSNNTPDCLFTEDWNTIAKIITGLKTFVHLKNQLRNHLLG